MKRFSSKILGFEILVLTHFYSEIENNIMNVKAYMHDANKVIHHFTHATPLPPIMNIDYLSDFNEMVLNDGSIQFMSIQYSIFLESTFLFIYDI